MNNEQSETRWYPTTYRNSQENRDLVLPLFQDEQTEMTFYPSTCRDVQENGNPILLLFQSE